MRVRTLIETIFGVYTPVTYDVLGADGTVLYTAVADGAAGVDWPYVGGIMLFALVLYSFFRLLGVVFKR